MPRLTSVQGVYYSAFTVGCVGIVYSCYSLITVCGLPLDLFFELTGHPPGQARDRVDVLIDSIELNPSLPCMGGTPSAVLPLTREYHQLTITLCTMAHFSGTRARLSRLCALRSDLTPEMMRSFQHRIRALFPLSRARESGLPGISPFCLLKLERRPIASRDLIRFPTSPLAL